MRMKGCIPTTSLAWGFLAMGLASGCDTTGPAAISVAIDPPNVTLDAGSTQLFTANVENDLAAQGVTWSITGCSGSAACGSLTNVTNFAATYIASESLYTGALGITATSVADPTKSFTATVAVVAAISVYVSPSDVSLQAGGRQDFTATVANDSHTAGVSWSMTGCVGGAAVCGSLTNLTSAGATYVAPALVPADVHLSVAATSLSDHTKSFTVAITVNAVAVFVSPETVSVAVKDTQPFIATVTNDPANAGVMWTLTGPGCSGPTCGTLLAATSASGAAVGYVAPAALPDPRTVTLTAVSVTDKTKSASTTLTITPPVILVTVSPQVSEVALSAQQQFIATVAKDSANAGVTWTLSGGGCAGAACGTLSAPSSASGAPVTYTAPAIVPLSDTVTVTATSVTDPSKTATVTFAITSLVAVTITPTGFVGVDVGTTQQFGATVSNDPGSLGVTWTVSGSGCAGADCGTISPAGTYTAPAVVPTPVTVTITATSVTDYTKSASATVVITTPGVLTLVVSPASLRICTAGLPLPCRNHNRTITAYVFNDPGNGGVAWSAGLGSISPTTSASGTAVTYTAPSRTVGSTFVKATSVDDPTKSASVTVTLIVAPHPPGGRP